MISASSQHTEDDLTSRVPPPIVLLSSRAQYIKVSLRAQEKGFYPITGPMLSRVFTRFAPRVLVRHQSTAASRDVGALVAAAPEAVVRVSPSESAQTAAQKLLESDLGALVVVEEERVRGVVSDADFTKVRVTRISICPPVRGFTSQPRVYVPASLKSLSASAERRGAPWLTS